MEEEILNEDQLLEENVRKLMDRHRQYKKQQLLEKDLSARNLLLQKYDTCRALALKLKSRVSEELPGKSKSSKKIEEPQINQNIIQDNTKNYPDELPETTIISSPKRGKIRPRSAPSHRSGKPSHTKSANDLYSIPKSKHQGYDSPPRNTVPKGFDSQQPLDANTLTHDEWWLLAQQTKTKNKNKNLLKSQSQPELTQQEMKEHLKKTRKNKSKRTPPSAYLAEYREKEEKHLKDIAITVMEEAYLMESKAYGCVDEANAYAKALGLKKRFSIYTRNENENSKQQFLKTKSSFNDLLTAQKALQQSTTHHGSGTGTGTGGPGITTTLTQEFYHQNITNIMKGCSNRLEKMCVEVMGIPGEPTQLISLDKFYLEHHKLQLEIRQRRNLMNKTERQLNITIENNEINKNKNENILRRAQTVAILPSGTGGEGGTAAPITGINPNDILLLQQKQTLSKKKESKKDENKKQITEEKLLKILEDTKEVTKILEDQLKELKLRGWNENVL